MSKLEQLTTAVTQIIQPTLPPIIAPILQPQAVGCDLCQSAHGKEWREVGYFIKPHDNEITGSKYKIWGGYLCPECQSFQARNPP